MEDVGAQVASPVFIHQTLPPMGRKRNLYYHRTLNPQPQPSELPQRRDDWNPKSWNWDSTRFLAKPINTEILQSPGNDTNNLGLKNKCLEADGDERRLELNLGGSLNSMEEIPASRPGKRVCSGPPGGSNYPMCQVDNCKEDLSSAKDYHRRHKVCEFHSKATKAPVGNQMQRFCQQCSRFHPLMEFDEGKRSCRHRLAGHNRRRRKTQPDEVTSQMLVPGNHGNAPSANMDLVALLTALASSQAVKSDVRINASSAPNRDQLLQILGKINTLPLPMDLASELQKIEGLTRKNPESCMVNHQNDKNGISPSTKDLLAALSTTLTAPSPICMAVLPQRNSKKYESAQTNLASLDPRTTRNTDKTSHDICLVSGERSSSSHQSPSQDSDCHVQDARSSLSLQLFTSSPENESCPTVASSRKYFSSDSSKSVDRSQSSSPVMQELFPLRNSPETVRSKKTSSDRIENTDAVGSKTSCLPLELFNVSNRVAEKTKFQSFPYQSGCTSSGSDHSPPSLNSDAQGRTGRILFKLFDKDPSQLPGTLRNQIFNWLSNCPSNMESFIRPGCVVLSVYVSMPASDWEQLQGYLLQRLNFLLQGSASDFWRNTRFLVNTGNQLASNKNGKIRLCKSWTTWNSPQLISMSPIAVVPGQETNLVIRGRNLTNDGIKIRCGFMGSYASMVSTGSTCRGAVYDEIKLNGFRILGTSSGILGRCFIEVENGFRGNFFPLIIADSAICLELKHLEDEFQECSSKACDDITEEQRREDLDRPRSREEILHFLNELGWLFQTKKSYHVPEDSSNFSLTRYKFLLVFSVERDCTALVKTLLDMMLESNSDSDGLLTEKLVEFQLLNRAVKRRCAKMVDMLIHYSNATTEAPKKFVFPPNLAGPGGITPLHLAACTLESDNLIDILTNDPQEIGLSSWNSLLDASGHTPYSYAALRNNQSYNTLVARKLVDRKSGQVSLTVMNYEESGLARLGSGLKRSCGSCSAAALNYHKRVSGSHRLFPTPIIHSMLAVATVCVCVCLFMHAFPNVRQGTHFSWQGLDYGTM